MKVFWEEMSWNSLKRWKKVILLAVVFAEGWQNFLSFMIDTLQNTQNCCFKWCRFCIQSRASLLRWAIRWSIRLSASFFPVHSHSSFCSSFFLPNICTHEQSSTERERKREQSKAGLKLHSVAWFPSEFAERRRRREKEILTTKLQCKCEVNFFSSGVKFLKFVFESEFEVIRNYDKSRTSTKKKWTCSDTLLPKSGYFQNSMYVGLLLSVIKFLLCQRQSDFSLTDEWRFFFDPFLLNG